MKIAHVLPVTLIDYPDRVAALVYVAGCAFLCPFCHNAELVLPERIAGLSFVPQEEVLDLLAQRKGFLDAVVITGGEPALQPDLVEFVRAVKRMGFLVKLDTNGSRPEVVEQLLAEHLVDYVAMDVKAPPDRYEALCGVHVDLGAIRRSVDLLIARAPDYEFRTTVAPTLTEADLGAIADWLSGAKRYILQRFTAPAGKTLIDPTWRDRPALSQDVLEAVWDEIRGRFPDGGVR